MKILDLPPKGKIVAAAIIGHHGPSHPARAGQAVIAYIVSRGRQKAANTHPDYIFWCNGCTSLVQRGTSLVDASKLLFHSANSRYIAP